VVTKENLDKVAQLEKIAKKLGLSLPVLAITWCLKNENVSTVMLGASKLSQLEENFKAIEAKAKLTPEVMEEIEKALNNKPIHPVF